MRFTEKIAERLENYFKEKDWTYDYDTIHGVFSIEADLQCKFGSAMVVYQAMDEAFLTYTTIAEEARMGVRADVAEYLHRANYGLPNGNFEFDYDDGAVHFKTYFDCPEGVVTDKQLEDSMAIGLTVFDRYGDGLYEIMRSASLAKGIIEKIEEQEG